MIPRWVRLWVLYLVWESITYMTSNGKVNGNERGIEALANATPRAYFAEDAEGVTLGTGTVEARFSGIRGGRLKSWQWRTIPPPDALNPATRHDPPRLLTLADSPHGALVDHFLPLGTRLEDFAAGTHREFGDFVEEPYAQQVMDLGGEIRVAFQRDGAIKAGKRVADVRLMKSAGVRPGSSDLSVLYRVINSSLRPIQILFAVEYNLYAPGLAEDPNASGDAFYLVDGARPPSSSLAEAGVSPAATSATLANPTSEIALQLGWDRECDLWRMPSPSGKPGAICLLAVWRLSLPPRDNWALGLWLAPV